MCDRKITLKAADSNSTDKEVSDVSTSKENLPTVPTITDDVKSTDKIGTPDGQSDLYYTEMRNLPSHQLVQDCTLYENGPATSNDICTVIYEEPSTKKEEVSSDVSMVRDQHSVKEEKECLKLIEKRKQRKSFEETGNEGKDDSAIIYDDIGDVRRLKLETEIIVNENCAYSLAEKSPAIAPFEKKNDDSQKLRKWAHVLCMIAGFVTILVIVLVVLSASLASVFSELGRLKTEIASLTQVTRLEQTNMQGSNRETTMIANNHEDVNYTNIALFVQESIQNSDRIQNISYIADSNKLELDDIRGLINNLNYSPPSNLSSQIDQLTEYLEGFFGVCDCTPASSCAALPPSSPSGYYWVRASNGYAVRVYCDMTRSCGGVTGGWMRVAELVTNSSQQCPDSFIERIDFPNTNIRYCVSSSSSPGCSSGIEINTFNINYTRVCGRVIGYQIGGTNAFAVRVNNISSYYVDGVSITHGNPRQHIWTFAAARDETTTDARTFDSKCPCILQSGGITPPEFVGNDYFCDTGSADGIITDGDFIGEDPLWDGTGCGSTSTCCSFNTPPWFYKQLSQPTTDNIEMRVCRNEENVYEDVAIKEIEIYIQ